MTDSTFSRRKTITRRRFLETLAAVPFAAGLGESSLLGGTPPSVAVVGAGAFGGWTALQLLRLGARVTLMDAWGPGNPRSSSGGPSRVIRAIYGPDRIYSEMVKRSFALWTGIDETTDEDLYVETGVLWMHRKDDSYVRASLPILEDLGFTVEPVPLDEARGRYPQIDFRGVESVWLEPRGGILSAQKGCVALRNAFTAAGGTYRTMRALPGTIKNGAMASLRLDDDTRVEADAFVFACGPWLGQIFPDVIGEKIRPTRQEVYYFRVPEGSDRYRPENLPVWVDFGERIIYGIPDTRGRSFKIADDTRGEPIDPTTDERIPRDEGIERARQFLAERFPEMADAPLVAARVCQYENSPDGHLIIDRHPEASNVWIAGGGSGHGFKLSPAVGEMTAAAILSGQQVPEKFRLERLREDAATKTQFEG